MSATWTIPCQPHGLRRNTAEVNRGALPLQVIAAQNEVVELEMRQKSEAGRIAELDTQVQEC